MNFNRDYKFFLKIAVAFLQCSILLPFAIESATYRVLLNVNYVPGYEPGTAVSQLPPTGTYRELVFQWSFMRLWVNLPISMTGSPEQIQTRIGPWVQVPPYCWRLSSRLVSSILVLQIVLVVLGYLTVIKAQEAKRLLLFFLGIIALGTLYWHYSLLTSVALSFSFWILIVVALFTMIAIERAPKHEQ